MSKSVWRLEVLGLLVLLVGCTLLPDTGESWPGEVREPSVTDGSLTTDKDLYTASCQGEGENQICTVTLELTTKIRQTRRYTSITALLTIRIPLTLLAV